MLCYIKLSLDPFHDEKYYRSWIESLIPCLLCGMFPTRSRLLEQAILDENATLIHSLIPTASQDDLDVALLRAILLDKPDILSALVDAGANPNTQDMEGRTPFYLSLLYNRLSITQQLLSFGCDVNVSKVNQSNALHYASKLGNMTFIQLLVDADCDLDITNWGGNTAVLIACRFGHRDVVQFLLDCGACVNVCNRLGHYPLHYAAYYDDTELINVLISRGARGDCHTYLGVTPLMLACQRRKCSAVNTLVPMSNLDFRERLYGGTALFWAIHSGCRHCVRVLISRGASMSITDNSGRSTLMQAVQSNAPHILSDLLQDHYYKTNESLLSTSANLYTLHFACYLGHKTCINEILASPQSEKFVNLKDPFGDTPLLISVKRLHYTITNSLTIQYGAHINEKTMFYDAQGRLKWRNYKENNSVTPFKYPFFKTYSSVKMGMIDLLRSSDQVQIVAPATSSGFDFDTWLDHGPDAFNLKVTSLELTDWLKNHMQSPLALREYCRGYLRRILGYRASDKVERLPMPQSLKDFVNMKELSELRSEDMTIGNIRSHPWVDIE